MFHVIKEEPEFWGWRPRAVSHMVPGSALGGFSGGRRRVGWRRPVCPTKRAAELEVGNINAFKGLANIITERKCTKPQGVGGTVAKWRARPCECSGCCTAAGVVCRVGIRAPCVQTGHFSKPNVPEFLEVNSLTEHWQLTGKYFRWHAVRVNGPVLVGELPVGGLWPVLPFPQAAWSSPCG